MSPTHLTWHPMSSWPSRLSVIVAAALSNTMQSLSEAQKRKERPCHLHDRHDCRQANCYAQRTTEKNPHVNCPRAKKCLPPSSQRCRTHRRAIGAPNCEGTFIGARGTICGGAICAQPICNGGVAPPFNGFIFLRSSFDFLMFFTCCSSAFCFFMKRKTRRQTPTQEKVSKKSTMIMGRQQLLSTKQTISNRLGQ